MFLVASDLSEAQRDRLSSSLSLKGINVTSFTPRVRTRQQHEQNIYRGRLR